MAQKSKYISLVLPAGEAVWPHLNEIEVYKVVDKKGKPVIDKDTKQQQEKRSFNVKMRYDQATLTQVQEMIIDAARKLNADDDVIEKLEGFQQNTPFKTIKQKDKEGNVIGKEVVVEAKSGEDHRPGLFDAKRQSFPLTKQIGGGSKLRIKVTVNVYDGFNGGVNLYLDQVQVIDLVEGGRSKECAFDETDGYTADESDDGGAFADEPTDSTDAYKL